MTDTTLPPVGAGMFGRPDPLVTILINNYNYAEFVGEAVESALAQTYPQVEVVVVDDGSDDGSKEVLAIYGDRITAIFKENGGQASAINTGFARSRGDVVTFLDADDVLDHALVARVVEAFRSNPSIGLVQCRLELTDAACVPLGLFVPPAYVRMATGDLRTRPAHILNASWWAPTSGISVASHILRRVLPLPEELFPISADAGLIRACALCAPVSALREPGGLYRSHGNNRYNRGGLEPDKIQSDLTRYVAWQKYLSEFAASVGVRGYPTTAWEIHDTVFAIQRLVAARFARGRPTTVAVRFERVRQGIRAAILRPDVDVKIRILLACWFILMGALPRYFAERLATKTLFQPNLRRPQPQRSGRSERA